MTFKTFIFIRYWHSSQKSIYHWECNDFFFNFFITTTSEKTL